MYKFIYSVPTANGYFSTKEVINLNKKQAIELKKKALEVGYKFRIERM